MRTVQCGGTGRSAIAGGSTDARAYGGTNGAARGDGTYNQARFLKNIIATFVIGGDGIGNDLRAGGRAAVAGIPWRARRTGHGGDDARLSDFANHAIGAVGNQKVA